MTTSTATSAPSRLPAFKAEGREPVLRVRMPDEDVTFTDMVRGESLQGRSIPDYVIVRADGSPLYTAGEPVDDALVGITYVLRGEDLLSSPRQVVLIRALMDIGVASYMPVFGHLPTSWARATRSSPSAIRSQPVPAPGPRLYPRGPAHYLSLLG